MSLMQLLMEAIEEELQKREFKLDVSGGHGYRKLREAESEQLKESLNKFSEESTKISQQEIEFKKDLVKWLVKLLRSKEALGGHLWRTFNTGSAYERVQAGEAKDFDIMIFLNIGKWAWKVHDDFEKPGYCWLTRGAERENDNPRSFTHLLDENGRLSALKVRKLFTSKIDRFLRKNSPLEFEHVPLTTEKCTDEGGEQPEKEKFKVYITRKYQGPATTLTVECRGISSFTIDLVNSLDRQHIRRKGAECDYVAKPYDKQKIFGSEYEHLWRKSYSRQESRMLRDIDEGNKIHRKLLRIFKILRVNQPQLKLLKTYVFKNLLLYMSDVEGQGWGDESIADRFVDMVIALRNCLANHELPVYFNQEINLLQQSEYDKEQLDHVMGYLRRIANKGIQGYESLLATIKEIEPVKRKLVSTEETAEGDVTEKKAKTGGLEMAAGSVQTPSGSASSTADADTKPKRLNKTKSTNSKQPANNNTKKGSEKKPKKQQQRFSKRNAKESDKVKENGKYIRKKSSSSANGAAAGKPTRPHKQQAATATGNKKEITPSRRSAGTVTDDESKTRPPKKLTSAIKAKSTNRVQVNPTKVSSASTAFDMADYLVDLYLTDPTDYDVFDLNDGADDYMNYELDFY